MSDISYADLEWNPFLYLMYPDFVYQKSNSQFQITILSFRQIRSLQLKKVIVGDLAN